MAGEDVVKRTAGFQWERYEAWRHHPVLKVDKRNLVPGLGVGFSLFIAFVIYDKMIATHDDHHGHH